jgi:Delta3-Delta2-enoyl-CoA isomerase
MLRSIIEHKKVFVLALNGPGVGGGAAWFEGAADIVLAAEGAYLQVPFNALGLVPENGSAIAFTQSMGVHRSNDFLMFGRQLTVEELEKWGMVNRIFPKEGFHESVLGFLNEQLAVNDGKSMMETKRLQNAPLRDARILAVYNSVDALAERFVSDAPLKRLQQKKAELEGKLILLYLMGNVPRVTRMLCLICAQPNPRNDLPKSESWVPDMQL